MSGLCMDLGHHVAAFTGIPLTRERFEVLEDIAQERLRQIEKHGEQSHLPDGTGHERYVALADTARRATDQAATTGELTWRHIALEEIYEAMAEDDIARLRTELVQSAAVFVAWIEALDGRQ